MVEMEFSLPSAESLQDVLELLPTVFMILSIACQSAKLRDGLREHVVDREFEYSNRTGNNRIFINLFEPNRIHYSNRISLFDSIRFWSLFVLNRIDCIAKVDIHKYSCAVAWKSSHLEGGLHWNSPANCCIYTLIQTYVSVRTESELISICQNLFIFNSKTTSKTLYSNIHA